ncbi:MAG TPA: hypothetical protein VFI96_03270, partial [Longimicrobiaceae bacterium]|nr:hypothetical protein [Longimicrobiaceae bacterium]
MKKAFGAVALLALTACAAPSAAPVPGPQPGSEESNRLPPVPARTGPLALSLVHPGEGAELSVDSTFVFGSTGTGEATLRINGAPVEVAPNGAFLAFLP